MHIFVKYFVLQYKYGCNKERAIGTREVWYGNRKDA